MKKLKEFLGKYKICLLWLFLIITIIAILIDKIFSKQISFFHSVEYIQPIFFGLITICVRFLLNLYQKIRKIKDKSRGEDIESILNRKFYKKLQKHFNRCLFFPLLGILFIALISPFFLFSSKITVVIIVLITFISILNLTNIYNWVEEVSHYDIEKFIKEAEADDEDLVKMYEALFSKYDGTIQSEFKIYPPWLLEQFINKISIIDKEKEEKIINNIQKLLESFYKFFYNRSIWFIFPTNFFNKFLDLHFKIWKLSWHHSGIKNYGIFSIVQNIFYQFFDTILKEKKQEWIISVFFEKLEEHCRKFSKEKEIISLGEEKREIYYVEELFNENIIFKFFEEAPTSPLKYIIWRSFPHNWKITVETIKDEENIISKILWKRFFVWSFERIWKVQTETFDAHLEEITRELFPLVKPTLWAPILIFVFKYSINKSIKSVIEMPWTFGFIDTVNYYEEKKKNTYELAKILFPDILNKENINKYLEELEKLDRSKIYEKDEKKLYKLNILKKFFQIY